MANLRQWASLLSFREEILKYPKASSYVVWFTPLSMASAVFWTLSRANAPICVRAPHSGVALANDTISVILPFHIICNHDPKQFTFLYYLYFGVFFSGITSTVLDVLNNITFVFNLFILIL